MHGEKSLSWGTERLLSRPAAQKKKETAGERDLRLCDCGRAAELAEMELAAPALTEDAKRERSHRISVESRMRGSGRNNAVYVVKVRGQLVIKDEPHPMPFVRAFSGEHPSKHALAYIERVAGKNNANA